MQGVRNSSFKRPVRGDEIANGVELDLTEECLKKDGRE